VNAWFDITLRLANIVDLSDDEMQAHFWALDGRWSKQTKSLIERHGAKGLSLNSNWALVRQNWTCPCCGRDKPSVVRLGPNGILLARLDLHHDHIADWVSRAFDFRTGQTRKLTPEEIHVPVAARNLAERFSPVLVCNDCNAADGAAKLNTSNQIDPYFSFSPQEIREFISVSRNAPHIVDPEKAHAIWIGKRPEFEARKSLIDQLVRVTMHGSLRRMRSIDETRGADAWIRMEQRALYKAIDAQPDKRTALVNYENFIIRSTLNDGAGLTAAKRKTRPSASPTDAEFVEIDADVSSICRPWREAPQGWICACCGRSKREICRKSNAGKWTARIFRHSEYSIESDYTAVELRRAIYPMFVTTPIVGDAIQFSICQDCTLISTQLKAGHPEISDHFYLSLADLRDSIVSQSANQNHEVNLSVALERVADNHILSQAIDAFLEHRNLAGHAFSRFDAVMKSGWTDGEARAYAARKVEETRSLPERALDPFIDWLIDEGNRLRWRASDEPEGDVIS
jgi:rubredoxin